MTEQEAKGRWCPFARNADSNGAFNRTADGAVHRTAFNITSQVAPCLGSGCMAWRWDNVAYSTGHCGLAGGGDSR